MDDSIQGELAALDELFGLLNQAGDTLARLHMGVEQAGRSARYGVMLDDVTAAAARVLRMRSTLVVAPVSDAPAREVRP